MLISWAKNWISDVIAQVGDELDYLVSIRSIRAFGGTQRYAKVLMRSPTNGLADVERCEQRVAIHYNELSIVPSSHDPVVLTSTQQEIEGDVYESVR